MAIASSGEKLDSMNLGSSGRPTECQTQNFVRVFAALVLEDVLLQILCKLDRQSGYLHSVGHDQSIAALTGIKAQHAALPTRVPSGQTALTASAAGAARTETVRAATARRRTVKAIERGVLGAERGDKAECPNCYGQGNPQFIPKPPPALLRNR
jgi:hypothetical protein